MDRGLERKRAWGRDVGRKAAGAAVTLCVTAVLLAPAAWAADESDENMQRGGIAIVVILLIAAIWFFGFRNKDEGEGAATDGGPPSDDT
jgi:hypothetical protein